MMQNQATFYLLNDTKNSEPANSSNESSPKLGNDALLFGACVQAAHFYRQNKKVFIYSENQNQAHELDEMLWAFDADSFVPHNLMGEGPSYGSPVEISWQPPTNRRAVLINLTANMPHFASQFAQVIDFVPNDETLKQQARSRYRGYQQLGFAVKMNDTIKP
jgi:DNA polymerase III subunit chi